MLKFLSILPQALEIARIAEAAVPLSGQGKAKLAFALNVAEAAFETEEDLRKAWGDRNRFMEAIARAIPMAVALLNAAGVFKRTAPAQ